MALHQHRFKTRLFKGGEAVNSSTFADMEFDSITAFGTKGRVPVKVTMNGYVFPGTLMPYGGRHLLTVNKIIQAAAHVKAGDEVEIVIEYDDTPRAVNVPADLAAALRKSTVAQTAWDTLSPSLRKEYVQAIEAARLPETRTHRIQKTIGRLISPEHYGRSTK